MPITARKTIAAPITVMDIKTVEYKGNQEPALITLTHSNDSGPISKPFIIKHNINFELAINTLWSRVFNYIISNESIKTIFVHGLGEQGIHIYKYLFQSFSRINISCIIDNDNKFINIKLKHKSRSIIWLDSNRIFPVSVIDLCKIFEIQVKITYPINKLYCFEGMQHSSLRSLTWLSRTIESPRTH